MAQERKSITIQGVRFRPGDSIYIRIATKETEIKSLAVVDGINISVDDTGIMIKYRVIITDPTSEYDTYVFNGIYDHDLFVSKEECEQDKSSIYTDKIEILKQVLEQKTGRPEGHNLVYAYEPGTFVYYLDEEEKKIKRGEIEMVQITKRYATTDECYIIHHHSEKRYADELYLNKEGLIEHLTRDIE